MSIREKLVKNRGIKHNYRYNYGIEYIEIRILDIFPFDKSGVSLDQLYFLQVFIIYCTLKKKIVLNDSLYNIFDKNHEIISLYGRKKDVTLFDDENSEISFVDFSNDIFDDFELISKALDKKIENNIYFEIVKKEREKIIDKMKLPSSKVCCNSEKMGILNYGLELSKELKKGS